MATLEALPCQCSGPGCENSDLSQRSGRDKSPEASRNAGHRVSGFYYRSHNGLKNWGKDISLEGNFLLTWTAVWLAPLPHLISCLVPVKVPERDCASAAPHTPLRAACGHQEPVRFHVWRVKDSKGELQTYIGERNGEKT